MTTELTPLEVLEEAVINRATEGYDWVPAEAALAQLKHHPTYAEGEVRTWRKRVLEKVRVMRVAPNDVLVWRLPELVLNDPETMERVRAIAKDFADVCRKPILILEDGTDLKPEHVPGRESKPVIHLPKYLQP